MEFVVKHFSVLYPDITYAEVESTFLLAYINTWGFHVPGPDPDSQGNVISIQKDHFLIKKFKVSLLELVFTTLVQCSTIRAIQMPHSYPLA